MSEKSKIPLTICNRLRSLDSKAVLIRLGHGNLFDCLAQSWNYAATIDSQLGSCVYFKVTDAETLDKLGRRSQEMEAEWVWEQLSQLVIIISRSSSRAIQRLVEGILIAIEHENEIAIALAARAIIEHCAALTWLRTSVLNNATERIRGTVWPQLDGPGPLQLLDSDRTLLKTLFRFALGTRAIEDSRAFRPVELCAGSWKKYRDKVESVPEEVEAEQVMNYLDKVRKQEGCHDFRLSHALLSEYCHPNSASRMFDFAVHMKLGISRVMSIAADAEFSPGLLNVMEICHDTIPRVCEQISISLSALLECCHPQALCAPESEHEIPSPGATCAVIGRTGQVVWLDMNQISPRDAPLGEMTPEQESRAQDIAPILADPIGMAPEEWIRRLRMNVNIENELRLSEAMARAYSQEMADRPGANDHETKLVHQAILQGFGCRTFEDLLSILPSLKSLRESNRLFARIKDIQSKVE